MQQGGNQSYQGIRNEQRPYPMQVVLPEEEIGESHSKQPIPRLANAAKQTEVWNHVQDPFGGLFLFNRLTYRRMILFCPYNHILAIEKGYSQGEK